MKVVITTYNVLLLVRISWWVVRRVMDFPDREWVVRKRLEGMSARQISRQCGVSLTTVYRWLKAWREDLATYFVWLHQTVKNEKQNYSNYLYLQFIKQNVDYANKNQNIFELSSLCSRKIVALKYFLHSYDYFNNI